MINLINKQSCLKISTLVFRLTTHFYLEIFHAVQQRKLILRTFLFIFAIKAFLPNL